MAGIVIALSGPGEAIALDAATFAVSAACLAALRLRPRAADAPETAADEGRFGRRLRAGWAEVRSRPWLASGLGAIAAYHVFVLPAVYILGPRSPSASSTAPRAGP